MTPGEYDLALILPHHLEILREIESGRQHMRNGISPLIHRGLVNHWLYHVEVSLLGKLALKRLFEGGRVEAGLVGKGGDVARHQGVITGVYVTRAMGERITLDPYRPNPGDAATLMRLDSVTLNVHFDGRSGTHCFYEAIVPNFGRCRDVTNDTLVSLEPEAPFRTRYHTFAGSESHPAFNPERSLQRTHPDYHPPSRSTNAC